MQTAVHSKWHVGNAQKLIFLYIISNKLLTDKLK